MAHLQRLTCTLMYVQHVRHLRLLRRNCRLERTWTVFDCVHATAPHQLVEHESVSTRGGREERARGCERCWSPRKRRFAPQQHRHRRRVARSRRRTQPRVVVLGLRCLEEPVAVAERAQPADGSLALVLLGDLPRCGWLRAVRRCRRHLRAQPIEGEPL